MQVLLVALVARYFLERGIDYAEAWTDDEIPRLERWVKAMVPGTRFDETAWIAVRMILTRIPRVAGAVLLSMGEHRLPRGHYRAWDALSRVFEAIEGDTP